jgi:shikimate kinase
MISVLIGHRGAGKSTFLQQIQAHSPQSVVTIDLDQEIERVTGQSVAELFARGESEFRQIENRVCTELIERHCSTPQSVWIALGAGFSGSIAKHVRRLWLRRSTDRLGRSFFNRPRLQSDIWPLAEYLARFAEREERYRGWADEELTLPEGYNGGLEDFLFGAKWNLQADLTLLPHDFRSWSQFVERRSHWGIRHWELRDDLLSSEQLALACSTLPSGSLLFSRRKAAGPLPTGLRTGLKVDWALELGEPPDQVYALSLHERSISLDETVARFERSARRAQVLKLAVEIHSFAELAWGHSWWQQDPQRRSFLPRSPDGRWCWYRSLFGRQMPLHFLRESAGSSLDQPLLWQLLLQAPMRGARFAAVLGSPVEHSRSPCEHAAFFAERGMPMVAIPVALEEFSQALPWLREIGLGFAAVTAPLKEAAFQAADQTSAQAQALHSANTLYLSNTGVYAHNTDVLALERLAQRLPKASSIWLWGGGGVKSSVRQAWPSLLEISARQGTTLSEPPELLIWAVGRSRQFQWPKVRPQRILDLNYSEDSPGLEFAVHEHLPYQSGLEMFKLQAQFQRDFWHSLESNG